VIRTPGADVDRLQSPEPGDEDVAEARLRPRRLDEFVGQEALKAQLSISIQAATARGEPMDHVLFAGPPGLGKTSLARIVAEELGVEFTTTSGPALERKAEIASFLTALSPNSVFFVDEIHRLPKAVEETFYPAMEDRQLPITLGVGAGAKVVTLDLPPFTLIGATTRSGLLTTPLRDRFGIQHRLDHYGPDDLAAIVVRSAGVLNVAVHLDGARAIAERSRGTPRVANRLLKRVRDYAQIHGDGSVDASTAYAALDMLEVDHEGLDRLDREILRTICERFGGGPVGLSTLAVAVQEEQDTIEDVYEPYLLQRGFIQRTPRGRCATPHAYRHLGLPAPPEGQSLF
jgi:Holliday junction DNA helicase RuvB